MRKVILVFSAVVFCNVATAWAQTATSWNGKAAAVVFTYDDAIDVDLDNVVPSLDSAGLVGTFYLIGASGVTDSRIAEWRRAAQRGHELGNHSLFHPCAGGTGRDFVKPETDLRNYSVARAVKEVRATNTLLKAIDGKTKRTFAYPCGDMKIGDASFYKELAGDFSGARGTTGAMDHVGDVDLENIHSYFINGQDAAYMIGLVDQAIRSNSLVVFLFHGVGGGHALNVGLKEHNTLLRYVKQKEAKIWNATMVDVAEFIKSSKKAGK